MFFSADLLSKGRQNSLAVIWIAATLGHRSTSKKLSKKEVLGVNIRKACEFLEQPPEPLALRLTSNLMVGVVRVLSAQYGFYMNDVNTVFTKLKRALTNLQTNIDMAQTEARNDAITLDFNALNLLNEPELDLQGLINDTMRRVPESSIVTPLHSDTPVSKMSIPSFINTKPNSITITDRNIASIGYSSADFGGDDVFYQDYLENADQGRVSGVDVDWTLDLEGHDENRMSGLENTYNSNQPTGFGNAEPMDMNGDELAGKVPESDILEIKQKQKRKRKVTLIDGDIELSNKQLVDMRDQITNLLNQNELKIKKKKLEDSRGLFIQSRFESPSGLFSQELIQLYNAKVILPKQETLVDTEASRHPFKPLSGFMGGEMPDNEGGWGGQDIDMDGSLEVGRDVQEETPWAHTPSVSTHHRSVSTPSIGEAFAFETPRMSMGSMGQDSSPLKDVGRTVLLDDHTTASEKETQKFYNYMKDIMERADTDHVFLFDLIQSPSNRKIASQAFYHLLALATKGDIELKQDRAFSDICISL